MAYEPWRCAAAAGGGQAAAHALMHALPLSWTPIRSLGIPSQPHAARRHGRPDGGAGPRRAAGACGRWTGPTGKRTNRDGDVCTDRRPPARQATDGPRGLTGSLIEPPPTSNRVVPPPSRRRLLPVALLASSRRIIADYYSATTTRHSSSGTHAQRAHSIPAFLAPSTPPISLTHSLASLPAYCRYLSPRPPVSAVTGRSCRPRSCQAGLAAGG